MARSTVQKTRVMTEYEGVKIVGGAPVKTSGLIDGNMDITRAQAFLRATNPSVSLTAVHHVSRLYYMSFDDFYDKASYTESRID